MKPIVYIAIFLLATSCINDAKIVESYLFLRYENESSQSVSLSVFPVDRGYSNDTIWFTLQPGHHSVSDQFVSQLGPYDSFIPSEYPVFILDSAQVIFSDSLLVTHYSRLITYDSIQSPTAPIYYSE